MRVFYEAWEPVLNRQLSAADLDDSDFECFLNMGLLTY